MISFGISHSKEVFNTSWKSRWQIYHNVTICNEWVSPEAKNDGQTIYAIEIATQNQNKNEEEDSNKRNSA